MQGSKEQASAIHPHPNLFDGPRVWTARDFSGPSHWVLPVSEETREELKSAIAHAKRHRAEAALLKPEDFPLPSFAVTAAEIRRRLRDGSGFVVLRGLAPDDYAEDDVRLLYAGLGTHLGTILPQNLRGDMVVFGSRRRNSRGSRVRTDRSAFFKVQRGVRFPYRFPVARSGKNARCHWTVCAADGEGRGRLRARERLCHPQYSERDAA